MIGAAAGAHRVFLDRAQERRRLAGADDARLGVSDRRREPRSRAGDPAEPADEIERRALGRQHAARRSLDRGDAARPAATAAPSAEACSKRIAGSISRKASAARSSPATTPLLARRHHGPDDRPCRHDGVGGDVAGAAEVLQQRLAHDRLDENLRQGDERHQARLARACGLERRRLGECFRKGQREPTRLGGRLRENRAGCGRRCCARVSAPRRRSSTPRRRDRRQDRPKPPWRRAAGSAAQSVSPSRIDAGRARQDRPDGGGIGRRGR